MYQMEETRYNSVCKMTVRELKKELSKRGLDITGNKNDLIYRLQSSLTKSVSEHDDTNNGSNEHIQNFKSHQNKSNTNVSRDFFSFKDVEEALNSFSGKDSEDVKKWIDEIEDLSKICNWSEAQKLIYARRLLKGSAKLFVDYEKCGNSWESLKTSLISEFCSLTDSRQVHKKLSTRIKEKTESFQEYLYSMLEISSHANVEPKAVIQYVIDGIQDADANKAILYGANDIKDFRTKLRHYEEMKRNSRSGVGFNGVDKAGKGFRVEKDKTNARRISQISHDGVSVKRCFNCGDRTHLNSDCPYKSKGVKCFRCNKFGHVAIKCDQPQEVGFIEEKKFHSKPLLQLKLDGQELTGLVDSGSDLTLIRAKEYVKIGAPYLNRGVDFRGVGIGKVSSLGYFKAEVEIGKEIYALQIHVVPDNFMNYDLILGRDFHQQVVITFSSGQIKSIKKLDSCKIEQLPDVYHINTICETEEYPTRNQEVINLIKQYKPNKTEEVGVEMKIILKDDIPVYNRPRRLSPKDKEEVSNTLKQWLDDKIIVPSFSDYASPIVPVRKKNGEVRICVDYRQLNSKIIKDRYPLPLIEDQIDRLQGASIFTTLDLRNGFFHVRVHEDSQKYTAFVTPDGQFEFLRVPFGLCNAPSVFQRYINAVFRNPIKEGVVLTYLDDLVIPSQSVEEGIQRLKIILEISGKFGVEINWGKCQFLQKRIEYLGYIIENGSIRPSENKVRAVNGFPVPKDVKTVQSFLGLCGYFRKFICNYAMISRPLTDLLRKDVPFVFGVREQEAFQHLKQRLTNDPVLRLYRNGAETELHTDGSKVGYGAILLQLDPEDSLMHPVYYASWKTTPAEENYISYELEVLAIVKALKKFRVYLLGIPFKIVTDCQAFQMTLKKRDLCVRVARWALLLEEFDLKVEHRPGRSMKHVDSLSRYPCREVMLVGENEGLIAKIKRAQEKDKDLIKVLEEPEKNGYTVRNGLLYKEIGDELLLLVPKHMQVEIIKDAHRRGHFAVAKTIAILKRDYYFKKMRDKVERVIRNCIDCILAERKHGKMEGYLHPIDKGELPLDTYHLDHIGPLTSTKKNYQYILVVVDAFSKFVWLYPTKSTGSAEVVARLKKQSSIFGSPRRIITDRGTAFTSQQFRDYCKEEKADLCHITTGVPRANGQVERINRILIPLLTKLAAPKAEQWHAYVDVAQQILNSTPQRSIGTTPFHVMFGKVMKLKEDPNLREAIEAEIIDMFQEQRNSAEESIKKIQEENRKGFNKKRKPGTKYREGDLVAIKRTQLKPGLKLRGKFLGPYEVTRVLRNDRYVVRKIGDHEGPVTTTSTVDYMKSWTQSAEPISSSESDNETGGPIVGDRF